MFRDDEEWSKQGRQETGKKKREGHIEHRTRKVGEQVGKRLDKGGHARVVRKVVRESRGRVKGGLIYFEPLHKGEGEGKKIIRRRLG